MNICIWNPKTGTYHAAHIHDVAFTKEGNLEIYAESEAYKYRITLKGLQNDVTYIRDPD